MSSPTIPPVSTLSSPPAISSRPNENALEGLLQEADSCGTPVPVDFDIVTLGAVIWFPPEFTNVHQIIGQADLFGFINSRPNLNYVSIPGVWHSTNRLLPGYLSV